MAKIIDFNAARAAMGLLFSEGGTEFADEELKKLKDWSMNCLIGAIAFLGMAALFGGMGAAFGQGFGSKGWQLVTVIFLGLWIPGIALQKRLPTAALWLATFFALLFLLRLIFW